MVSILQNSTQRKILKTNLNVSNMKNSYYLEDAIYFIGLYYAVNGK